MKAIMTRELGAYFTSPIGYIYLGVFYFFAGIFFYGAGFGAGTADLGGVFSALFTIVCVTIPILTMRLHTEDRKFKTDQLLLTAPVSLHALVCGKFLAALVVYLFGISITLVFGLHLSFFVSPNWSMILGNFIGILLLGMALIAICSFLSAATESQVIAVISGFAVAVLLILIDFLVQFLPQNWMVRAIQAISFPAHYRQFTVGILNLPDVLFFLSVTGVFLFLTTRLFEKRRWH